MDNHTYAGVRAIYHEGVLTVLDPLTLPEGTEVKIDIHLPEEAPVKADFGRYPTVWVPAEALTGLIGLVALGGDALTDSEAIYDPDRD